MNNCPALLLCDFYKTVHSEQYPKNMTKIVSYFTPRMSRVEDTHLVMFGLQAFIKQYLIEYFNENFFNKPKDEVLADYNRILTYTLGEGSYESEKVANLYDLGYLPIEIRAIPEGTLVPVKVPMIEISNTHPQFAWIVNAIETIMSCSLWHPMISANVGYKYRQIVNKYYDKTVDDEIPRSRALGDFSMRGQESLESATKSSAAFCLSFLNTATVPAIPFLEKYYNCDCTKEPVAYGAISTEHSVMCSNYALDGSEETMIKRLLNEIYPNQSFSMVSDSYDYWNLVDNILPKCYDDIMKHNGTISIRGDSGDPVEIIAGKEIFYLTTEDEWLALKEEPSEFIREYFDYEEIQEDTDCIFSFDGDYILAHIQVEWSRERGGLTDSNYYFIEDYNVTLEENYILTSQDKGTVWRLYEIFGGDVNSKGYLTLNPHVKAIYGDSITYRRAEMIYQRLMAKGFACNTVSLGVGSFSMQCEENEKGGFNPYTRDTFGIAVKATYAEIDNKLPMMIFKNPKTDTGHFKKSQKGCCVVFYDKNGEMQYEDERTWDDSRGGIMRTVFKDGKMTLEYTLKEIRDKLHNGGF